MITAAGNYLAIALVAKIGRNIKILADNFTDDDHYLSTSANVTIMPPATNNYVINGNLLTG